MAGWTHNALRGGLAAISPNALAEFDKFHKLGSGEVEECAPFLRRYYNDMDSVLFAPRALDARSRWLRDPAVDKSFLARHLVAWLRLQNADKAWILKAPLFTYFLDELEGEIRGECGKFGGSVVGCVAPKHPDYAGAVAVSFDTVKAAELCACDMNDRWFDNVQILVERRGTWEDVAAVAARSQVCLLYTSPSPRDRG